jgi:SSS family solute:Na+ symporter
MFFCALIFMALYWIVVIVGMLSLPLLSKNLKNPVLSELISGKLGIILGSLLFVGLCAAIMSTMDTAINTGALTFTRDFYQRFFVPKEMRNIVIVSRFATIFVGICAFLVATRFQSILKTLGLSSEIMAEGLFIPGVAMVFMKKSYPSGALLSLILGGGFSLINFLTEIRILPLSLPTWPFSLPYGLALSASGFLIGITLEKTLFRKKPEQ